MHDLDRTQLEFQSEGSEMEDRELEAETYEYETEGFELEGEAEGHQGELESPFNEVQEMELSAGLLEVTGEQELDRFLGNLLGAAGQLAGRFLNQPTGQALGGMLKSVARQALPTLGRSVGQLTGLGGDVGARLASQGGRLLGLELEGLSQEDREFELARQFVRLAGASAARAAAQTGPPAAVAQAAMQAAAQRHAPGLLVSLQVGRPTPAGRSRRSGRWIRRGRTIVLIEI